MKSCDEEYAPDSNYVVEEVNITNAQSHIVQGVRGFVLVAFCKPSSSVCQICIFFFHGSGLEAKGLMGCVLRLKLSKHSLEI